MLKAKYALTASIQLVGYLLSCISFRMARAYLMKVPIARSCRYVKRSHHRVSPYKETVKDEPPPARLAPCGIDSSGMPYGKLEKIFESSSSASLASLISSTIGRRYSFPRLPSTITAVILEPSCLFVPVCCKSSLVIMVPQQGQVTPEPD